MFPVTNVMVFFILSARVLGLTASASSWLGSCAAQTLDLLNMRTEQRRTLRILAAMVQKETCSAPDFRLSGQKVDTCA